VKKTPAQLNLSRSLRRFFTKTGRGTLTGLFQRIVPMIAQFIVVF
jgi:hypothetical protein